MPARPEVNKQSAEELVNLWNENHDNATDLPKVCVWAIHISEKRDVPLPGTEFTTACKPSFTLVERRPLPKHFLPGPPDNAQPTVPRLPTKLGFPINLGYCPWDFSDGKYNVMAHMMFHDADAEGEGFGEVYAPILIGDILALRQDGKEIYPEHIDGLDDFINYRGFIDYHAANVAKDEAKKKAIKKAILKTLTPEYFHAFWQEWLRRCIARYPDFQPFTRTSPVQITYGLDKKIAPACGTCGELEGKLLGCAKCKVRYYCGKECQKKGWKEHKKCCGI